MSNTSFTHFIEIVQVRWMLTDLESDPSSSTWKINKLSSSISETANQSISCSRSVRPWPLLFMRHCQWLIGCWPSALMQSKPLTQSPTSCQALCVSLGAWTETQRTLVRSTAAADLDHQVAFCQSQISCQALYGGWAFSSRCKLDKNKKHFDNMAASSACQIAYHSSPPTQSDIVEFHHQSCAVHRLCCSCRSVARSA